MPEFRTPEHSPPVLSRALTGLQFFAVAFGCVVGVGWIIVLGDLIRIAGPGGTAAALAVAGVAIVLIALCYAEMGARHPAAGGELVYAFGLGGSGAAYATGWTLALVYTAACAFEAISIAQLLSLLFPNIEGPLLYSILGHEVRAGSVVLGAVFALAVGWLNLMGVEEAGRTQALVTFARLAMIILFLIVALVYAEPGNLAPLIPGDTMDLQFGAFLAALAAAPFMYGGFNVLATASEEAATSMRVVGRALLLAIVASAVFYILLVFAIGALVPRAELGRMVLPAAEAYEFAMGNNSVAKLVLIVALLGNLTAWNSLVMAGSRIFFALGRARLSPPIFAKLNRQQVPAFGIIFITLISIAALPLGRGFILPLVNITSACFGATYLVTCLALLNERKSALAVQPDFVAPGGAILIRLAAVCAGAIIIVALIQPWFASKATVPPEWITLVGWTAVAAIIWRGNRRNFVVGSEAERRKMLLPKSDG